jgi:hypothetical protein
MNKDISKFVFLGIFLSFSGVVFGMDGQVVSLNPQTTNFTPFSDETKDEDNLLVFSGYKIRIVPKLSQASHTFDNTVAYVDNAQYIQFVSTDKENTRKKIFVNTVLESKVYSEEDIPATKEEIANNEKQVEECRKKIEKGLPFIIRLTKLYSPPVEIKVVGKQ